MLRWYGAIFKRVSGKRTDCDCPSVACRLESCTGTIIHHMLDHCFIIAQVEMLGSAMRWLKKSSGQKRKELREQSIGPELGIIGSQYGTIS
jgi:hypothetical protein